MLLWNEVMPSWSELMRESVQFSAIVPGRFFYIPKTSGVKRWAKLTGASSVTRFRGAFILLIHAKCKMSAECLIALAHLVAVRVVVAGNCADLIRLVAVRVVGTGDCADLIRLVAVRVVGAGDCADSSRVLPGVVPRKGSYWPVVAAVRIETQSC
jgi:hypothetical protein